MTPLQELMETHAGFKAAAAEASAAVASYREVLGDPEVTDDMRVRILPVLENVDAFCRGMGLDAEIIQRAIDAAVNPSAFTNDEREAALARGRLLARGHAAAIEAGAYRRLLMEMKAVIHLELEMAAIRRTPQFRAVYQPVTQVEPPNGRIH